MERTLYSNLYSYAYINNEHTFEFETEHCKTANPFQFGAKQSNCAIFDQIASLTFTDNLVPFVATKDGPPV